MPAVFVPRNLADMRIPCGRWAGPEETTNPIPLNKQRRRSGRCLTARPRIALQAGLALFEFDQIKDYSAASRCRAAACGRHRLTRSRPLPLAS